MLKIKKEIVLMLMLFVALIAACGLGDQTGEANKIVAEANKMIVENNRQVLDANSLFRDVLGTSLMNVRDLAAYKKENSAKFDDLLGKCDEVEKTSTAIVEKFQQASQLKLNEKYKQYLELKVKEFSKNLEGTKLIKPLVKGFLEENNVEKINTMLEDYNKNFRAVSEESDALRKQADQIAKDNPNLIR